jgi:hypothetical protein
VAVIVIVGVLIFGMTGSIVCGVIAVLAQAFRMMQRKIWMDFFMRESYKINIQKQ